MCVHWTAYAAVAKGCHDRGVVLGCGGPLKSKGKTFTLIEGASGVRKPLVSCQRLGGGPLVSCQRLGGGPLVSYQRLGGRCAVDDFWTFCPQVKSVRSPCFVSTAARSPASLPANNSTGFMTLSNNDKTVDGHNTQKAIADQLDWKTARSS